jgi:hypothetical protein
MRTLVACIIATWVVMWIVGWIFHARIHKNRQMICRALTILKIVESNVDQLLTLSENSDKVSQGRKK